MKLLKIKILIEFYEIHINFNNFEQILHFSIFPILSPKFSKNHDFKIYQNHAKINQNN